MKQNKLFSIISVLCFLWITACKQSPQLPANKTTGIDSIANNLLAVNQDLIHYEDSVLNVYVATLDSGYLKSKLGFWYKINLRTQKALIREKDKCRFQYSIYSLNDSLLTDMAQAEIVVGKKNTIRGIEEALLLMRPGETATLILPWYLAYGMKGNDNGVAAYTSVKVHLSVY
jgi:chaperone required for assembly of F1-ATPase